MSPANWPDRLFETFKRAGITQVGDVPDAGHSRLIERCRADPDIRDIVLTTEEEGVALAAGAWLGGARSVLLMQSSGLGNCINMLSLARSCRFPLLMVITMRGEWEEFNPWQVPMGSIVDPCSSCARRKSIVRRHRTRSRARRERATQHGVRRRAHRRRDPVAAAHRQKSVDEMNQCWSAAPPWPALVADRSDDSSSFPVSARPPTISPPPATIPATSISGAPWAAPP